MRGKSFKKQDLDSDRGTARPIKWPKKLANIKLLNLRVLQCGGGMFV